MSYGMDAKLGISFQSSYGTLNTSSMHWLQPVSDTVSLKKAEIIRKGLRAIYDEGDYKEGVNTVAGDLTCEIDGLSVGALLSAVMGRTTVTSAALYTHTFKPRTADHNPLSAEQPFTYYKYMGDTGSAQLYSDLCGESIDLVIANGQLLTAKMGVVGGTYSQIAAIAATYGTNAALDWSVSSVSLGAAARTNVETLTFTFKNSLVAKQTLMAGKYPDRIKRNAARTVDVSGTILFDNQTDLQNFISQTQQRLTVQVTGTSNVQSGYNESLTIDVPSLLITDFPQGIQNAGELAVAFKGAGAYNVGSGCACAITLVNTRAGY